VDISITSLLEKGQRTLWFAETREKGEPLLRSRNSGGPGEKRTGEEVSKLYIYFEREEDSQPLHGSGERRLRREQVQSAASEDRNPTKKKKGKGDLTASLTPRLKKREENRIPDGLPDLQVTRRKKEKPAGQDGQLTKKREKEDDMRANTCVRWANAKKEAACLCQASRRRTA